jgi:hypothetical protein
MTTMTELTISPVEIHFPEGDLADLHRRSARTGRSRAVPRMKQEGIAMA